MGAPVALPVVLGNGPVVMELDPSISEAGICQFVDGALGVGPHVVEVAGENDGSAIGVLLDVSKKLVNSFGASQSIGPLISKVMLAIIYEYFVKYIPSVRVEIIEINLQTVNVRCHVCETLRSQAVAAVYSTLLPGVAIKDRAVVPRKCIETVAVHDIARRESLVSVVVVRSDAVVKMKVLLEVDNIVCLLTKMQANRGRGAVLVLNSVAVDDFWEAGHVVGEEVERRTILAELHLVLRGSSLECGVVHWPAQAKGRGHEGKGNRAEEHF